MKVLLTALHFANYRNFESVIRSLAARGHDVHLLADERETFGGQAFVERLAAEYPNVSFGLTPSPVDEPWFPLAQKLRFALDYVRFLDSRYAAAEKLRLRNIERTPRIIKWITSGVGGAVVGHRRTAALLKAIERRLPPSRAITALFEAQQPDCRAADIADLLALVRDGANEGRAVAWCSNRRLHHELGPPVEQGAGAHSTRCDDCLE
jgi:hypothetical protein